MTFTAGTGTAQVYQAYRYQTSVSSFTSMSDFTNAATGSVIIRNDGTRFIKNPKGAWDVDNKIFTVMVGTDTGTANNYVISPAPTPTSYVPGQIFVVQNVVGTQTGACTLNVSGLGALPIKMNNSDPPAGTIDAGQDFTVVLFHDGGHFDLISASNGAFAAINGDMYQTFAVANATSNEMATNLGQVGGLISNYGNSQLFFSTSSISNNVTYTNTYGKPLFATITTAGTPYAASTYGYLNGVQVQYMSNYIGSDGGESLTLCMMVPSGATWRFYTESSIVSSLAVF